MQRLLLSFEPGISAVRNELVVNPELRPAEDSLQAIRDRADRRGEKWTTLSHGSPEASLSPVGADDRVVHTSRVTWFGVCSRLTKLGGQINRLGRPIGPRWIVMRSGHN